MVEVDDVIVDAAVGQMIRLRMYWALTGISS